MALEVLHRLFQHARTHGERVALEEVGSTEGVALRVTCAELAGLVRAFAATIQHVVDPGDVVVICLPNRIECTAAFLGTLYAGAVGFLINPNATPRELRSASITSGAKAVIGTPEARDALSDLDVTPLSMSTLSVVNTSASATDPTMGSPFDQAHSGLMLLSSGTTAEPKIVFRDGPSLDAVARNTANAVGMTPDDGLLIVIPLCHSYGVEHGILAPVFAGSRVTLCNGFDARVVLERLRTGGVTILPGVPSLFEFLADRGDGRAAFPALRCAYSAGGRLPASVFEACCERLQLRVGQLYGSSEVGSVTFNDPHAPNHDPRSVGFCMEGVSVRIVDPTTQRLDAPLAPGIEGELAVRAPSMLKAYVGERDVPTRDDYFLTGDLARVDARGSLTITGRTRLLIDVGAFKVNPLEVEAMIEQHAGVRACLVLSAPVTDTISRVRALVVPHDLNNPPSSDSIRRFLRSRLSPHKIPRAIEMVASLPTSPTGKVLRRNVAS